MDKSYVARREAFTIRDLEWEAFANIGSVLVDDWRSPLSMSKAGGEFGCHFEDIPSSTTNVVQGARKA